MPMLNWLRALSHRKSGNSAEKLLDHFDRLTGMTPRFVQVSDEAVQPALYVAIYCGFPEAETITGFTIGLSHFHPPGGAHKELTISMRDTDDAWVLACGFLAFQLRERCSFACGDTINFRDRIAKSSAMSSFVAIHPRHVFGTDAAIDLGVRNVELVQLLPLYEDEREWLHAGGDLEAFLRICTGAVSMDPCRKECLPK